MALGSASSIGGDSAPSFAAIGDVSASGRQGSVACGGPSGSRGLSDFHVKASVANLATAGVTSFSGCVLSCQIGPSFSGKISLEV